MNADNSIPPQFPPPLPPTQPPHLSAPPPLGSAAEEQEPITGPLAAAEAILRQPRRVMYQVRQAASARLLLSMLVASATCSLAYGVVIGTFSAGTQLWAAPVKVVSGLLLTGVICLPSLYIFTCLSGSRARFSEICGLVAGLLLLTTILLLGFGPVAWLFSESTRSVSWMGGLHLLFWFIATCFGLRFLDQGFAHSGARSKAGLNLWIILFIMVAAQMTTALRPIVGTASTFLPTERKFFLAHWADANQN